MPSPISVSAGRPAPGHHHSIESHEVASAGGSRRLDPRRPAPTLRCGARPARRSHQWGRRWSRSASNVVVMKQPAEIRQQGRRCRGDASSRRCGARRTTGSLGRAGGARRWPPRGRDPHRAAGRSWRPRARTARGTGSCVRRLPAACSHVVRCASLVVSAGLSAGREEVAQHPRAGIIARRQGSSRNG